MWMLVLISVSLNYQSGDMEPRTDYWYGFETYIECFTARESLGYTMTGNPGYYPVNKQAVCIPVVENKIEK